jgi:hypothetical protein
VGIGLLNTLTNLKNNMDKIYLTDTTILLEGEVVNIGKNNYVPLPDGIYVTTDDIEFEFKNGRIVSLRNVKNAT